MAGIAIFGGTFNPIHNGHIQMIKEIEKLDFIDKILVMPDNIPPHKEVGFLADNFHRANMCKLAVNDIKKAVVDETEMNRGGKSYTFDTLCALKEKYNGDNLYLVCGGDMLISLDSWYKADQLFKLCTFIAFSRSNISKEKFNKRVKELAECGAEIIIIDSDIISVSSTGIRENLKKGFVSDGLLPECVSEYIIDNKVYG